MSKKDIRIFFIILIVITVVVNIIVIDPFSFRKPPEIKRSADAKTATVKTGNENVETTTEVQTQTTTEPETMKEEETTSVEESITEPETSIVGNMDNRAVKDETEPEEMSEIFTSAFMVKVKLPKSIRPKAYSIPNE